MRRHLLGRRAHVSRTFEAPSRADRTGWPELGPSSPGLGEISGAGAGCRGPSLTGCGLTPSSVVSGSGNTVIEPGPAGFEMVNGRPGPVAAIDDVANGLH